VLTFPDVLCSELQYEAGQFAMLKSALCKRGDAADHVLHIYDAFNISAEASFAFSARWHQDTRTPSSRPIEVTTLYLLKFDQPFAILREQTYLRSSVRVFGVFLGAENGL